MAWNDYTNLEKTTTMAEGGGGRGLWHRKKGQNGKKKRCSTPDRLSHFLEHARTLKDRIPFSPRTLRKVPSNTSNNEPVPIPRPSLQRPSSVTEKLLLEIMSKLYMPDKRLNTDLIVSNLVLCDPTHDILLVEDSDHYNLLHKAIIFGDLELLELLLDHGVDPNGLKSEEVCQRGHKKCPHENLGALHLASFVGHNDLVHCLLDHGASTSLQMAVYTSAVVNDQYGRQPQIFTSALESKTIERLSRCGWRPPVFFAILNNQLGTVKDLLSVQRKRSESPTSDNTFLCHLACRFKAYECFEYLLKEYPQAINTKDTDGLPLLLMALNNNMEFVKLLLDHDCDIHVLDDFWQPGTNILHLLLSVNGRPANDLIGLKEVTDECLKRGINVNGQRSSSNTVPLHELMWSINNPWYDSHQGQKGELFHETLKQLDKELKGCMTALLTYGADIHIQDSHCKTPLQILLSNIMYMHRYIYSNDKTLPCNMQEAFSNCSYGLDNTIECVDKLIALGAIQQDEKIPIVESFIESLISFSIESSFRTVKCVHPFQIFEEDVIFNKYVQLLKMLLDAGADPNASSESKLPPLLSLLERIDESPTGNVMIVDSAHRMLILIHILIENGANTKAGIGPGRHEIGCFDMLKGLIHAITKGSTVQTLDVLHTLVIGLIQRGASTNVYENIFELDDIPVEGRANSDPKMHQHAFLYQYLVFGMLNLRFVNEGPWYMNIFNVLYCQIEHSLLHAALAMAQAQFLHRHDYVDCECKSCDNFRLLLDSVKDKPRSLKVLCRLAVYYSVKGRLVSTVPYLPVPPALKSYLMSFQP